MNTKNDDLGKLLKLWFQSKKPGGEFNLNNHQGNISLRLCLVHVKYFPENIYFPEMLFMGKENIFKCLVAFQKMF